MKAYKLYPKKKYMWSDLENMRRRIEVGNFTLIPVYNYLKEEIKRRKL